MTFFINFFIKFFIILFFTYIKMSKHFSAIYHQEKIERLQKTILHKKEKSF